MSAPFGMYGGYKAESPESRALGNFAADKFSYRDQAKNIIELNNSVGFMSGMMRKMQKGIDDANANVIQQIQSYFTDWLVLLGGGGDTGLDFGDLKYVIQAIGALFGFADENGNITVPVNLFNSAWHFFSNYIGITDNFQELINQLIDNAIATILDLFGEVPIVGQALQQFAVIVSDIRDLLTPIAGAVQALFDALNINLNDITGIGNLFGPFKPIFEALTTALNGVNLPDFSVTFHQIALWTTPFVDAVVLAINALTATVEFFTGTSDLNQLVDVFTGFLNIFSPIPAFNLFGTPPTSLFDTIPMGSFANTNANYLANPLFTDATSVAGATDWLWDGTVKHGVNVNAGSVKIIGDSGLHELYSNPISVVQGQKVPMSIFTMWDTLVATGTPIQLKAAAFIYDPVTGDTVEQDTLSEILDEITSPGTASTDWEELSGIYTVPSGVTEVRVALILNTVATSGNVWFSDGNFSKNVTDSIIQLFQIQGLQETLSGIDQFTQLVIDNFLHATTGLPTTGAWLTDFFTEVGSWFDDTQITAGTASDAKIDVNDLINSAANSFFGTNSIIAGFVSDARAAMDKIYNDVLQNTLTLQNMQAVDSSHKATGKSVYINFNNYADGPLPSIFDVSYTGPGTSTLGIVSGKACWRTRQNGNRDAFVRYNVAPTDTDFQFLQGAMSGVPQDAVSGGQPYFYALGRMSTAAQQAIDGGVSAVFARAWSTGSFFQYRADIGCIINGVETVWVSNIPLTWSTNMSFVCGVGTNLRQYQVFSGNSLVHSHTEVGTASKIGPNYRQWGSKPTIRSSSSGTPNDSGSLAGAAVADNELPAVKGSTAMYYRTNTTVETFNGGNVATALPANFFGFVGRASRDIATNTANGRFTVTEEGSYHVNGSILVNGTMSALCNLLVSVNGAVAGWGQPIVPDNAAGYILQGHWSLYLYAGDVVELGTIESGVTVANLTGEATGVKTRFDITKVG